MKQLKTLPHDEEFFSVYAMLIRTIRRSKTAAQLVSAATEIGIIYTASLSALQPIFPDVAAVIALGVALLGTAVIEIGLRVLAPQSVDAVLYRRYAGLHLPMTIAVALLTIVLLGTSGLLSFKNSKVIVDTFAPEATQQETTPVDSIYQSQEQEERILFTQDSTSLAERFAAEMTATSTAFDQSIAVKERELRNYRHKEIRTKQSFATRKDQVLLERDQLKAERAQALAQLERQRQAAFTDLRTAAKDALTLVSTAYTVELDSIKRVNTLALQQRDTTVSNYGLGLGWFTLVCLFIFCVAVILDRVHAKGSGIEDKVEISQYDFMPSVWINAWQALRERLNYWFQERIKRFQDATPPAPLPTDREELYDPTTINNIKITLRLEQEAAASEEDNVILIPSKRRQIGFRQATENTDTERAHTKNSCAIKDTPTEYDLRQWKQRLKDYKKRLGRHTQKKLVTERRGETVSSRTLSAIENNQKWVEHYTQLLEQYSNLNKD
ncbi:MAG: hypothetical protein ACRBG0_01410 [Lewinella sp.]|uniref:hypothetical protein n=1 Tax=Lewinella sp. TaxID=2004506 RepID=UPI003D6AC6F7